MVSYEKDEAMNHLRPWWRKVLGNLIANKARTARVVLSVAVSAEPIACSSTLCTAFVNLPM
jgi:hypothetical protein